MSYSFTITAGTKADACTKVREQFDIIVLGQPPHAADEEAAVNAAQALIRVLQEPTEGYEIVVNMHGSLSWNWSDATPPKPGDFNGANVGISAGVREKPATKS